MYSTKSMKMLDKIQNLPILLLEKSEMGKNVFEILIAQIFKIIKMSKKSIKFPRNEFEL